MHELYINPDIVSLSLIEPVINNRLSALGALGALVLL